MPWRRHNRNITKEVFYDGTTIDGSRLEKAVTEIVEGVNDVKKGNTKQRFVATQYHSGFNPPNRTSTNYSKWPWLQHSNAATGSHLGVKPLEAPYNPVRLKGTTVPGINLQEGEGEQYVWTRTLYFDKPVVLHGVSIFVHNDTGANADRPYTGTYLPGATTPYTYYSPGAAEPPQGFPAGDGTVDLPIVLDIMNPGTPEDAEMTDVEFTRTLYTINAELSSTYTPDPSATGWNDFSPHYDSGDVTDARPLYGRVIEYRDLNIPVHQRARVRLAVALPLYDGTVYTQGTWGTDPWYLQAWSSTITVLEEVQTL